MSSRPRERACLRCRLIQRGDRKPEATFHRHAAAAAADFRWGGAGDHCFRDYPPGKEREPEVREIILAQQVSQLHGRMRKKFDLFCKAFTFWPTIAFPTALQSLRKMLHVSFICHSGWATTQLCCWRYICLTDDSFLYGVKVSKTC